MKKYFPNATGTAAGIGKHQLEINHKLQFKLHWLETFLEYIKNYMNFIITGGAGFIGSAVIRYLATKTNHQILNIDKLTYG